LPLSTTGRWNLTFALRDIRGQQTSLCATLLGTRRTLALEEWHRTSTSRRAAATASQGGRAARSASVSGSHQLATRHSPHVVAEHQLAALPAGEQQDQHDENREHQAPGFDGGAGRVPVRPEVDDRQHESSDVADHVLCRIANCPDTRIAEII